MNAAQRSTEFGISGSWLAEYTLRALDAGILVFDAVGEIVQWNVTAARLLGVAEEELCGRGIDDERWEATTLDGFRLTARDNPIRRTLDTGEAVDAETLAVHLADGTEAWLSVTALPIFGADRGVRGALASVVSIAGGARVGDILAAAVHCGRAAFEHSLTAHVVVDRAGRIVDWNRQLSRLVAQPEVELVGADFAAFCDVDLDRVWLDGSMGTVRDAPIVLHVRRGDDAVVRVVALFTLVDWPGNGRAVMIQLLDTRMFAALSPPHAARVVPFATYENVRIAMLTITPDGLIEDVNRAAVELFGRSDVELLRRPLHDQLTFLPTSGEHATPLAAMRSAVPLPLGLCTVRTGDGSTDVREVFASQADPSRSLMLIQLGHVPIQSLARLADRTASQRGAVSPADGSQRRIVW